ncbi:MAG: tRNA1(Val) (adenine(37)-N6)-methyltransferase [Ignavibacteriales bacterium]
MRKSAGEEIDLIRPDETLDDLVRGGLKVLQHRKGYRFSIDSVLLAHFAEARTDDKVMELGCGSGVVSILIAARQPACEIIGLEIQPALADMARRSIELNGLSDSIKVIHGDLRNPEVFLPKKKFSLVVANPPFWKMGEGKGNKDEENHIARHETQATLEDFINRAGSLLAVKGRLIMIHRAARIAEIMELCSRESLYLRRVRFVYPRSGADANLVLIEAQKGKKSETKVLSPLIVYGEDRKYTEEIMNIYFG